MPSTPPTKHASDPAVTYIAWDAYRAASTLFDPHPGGVLAPMLSFYELAARRAREGLGAEKLYEEFFLDLVASVRGDERAGAWASRRTWEQLGDAEREFWRAFDREAAVGFMNYPEVFRGSPGAALTPGRLRLWVESLWRDIYEFARGGRFGYDPHPDGGPDPSLEVFYQRAAWGVVQTDPSQPPEVLFSSLVAPMVIRHDPRYGAWCMPDRWDLLSTPQQAFWSRWVLGAIQMQDLVRPTGAPRFREAVETDGAYRQCCRRGAPPLLQGVSLPTSCPEVDVATKRLEFAREIMRRAEFELQAAIGAARTRGIDAPWNAEDHELATGRARR